MKKILTTMAFCTLITVFQSCDIASPINNTSSGNSSQTNGFGGNYSNQNDPNRSGVFSIEISQSNRELSGTATFERGNGESSGVLSVIGSSNDGVANLTFYDQRGNVIAKGVLSKNQDQYSFIQNTSSDWIPRDTILDRY